MSTCVTIVERNPVAITAATREAQKEPITALREGTSWHGPTHCTRDLGSITVVV